MSSQAAFACSLEASHTASVAGTISSRGEIRADRTLWRFVQSSPLVSTCPSSTRFGMRINLTSGPHARSCLLEAYSRSCSPIDPQEQRVHKPIDPYITLSLQDRLGWDANTNDRSTRLMLALRTSTHSRPLRYCDSVQHHVTVDCIVEHALVRGLWVCVRGMYNKRRVLACSITCFFCSPFGQYL